jgi:hypothetical protein
MRDRLADSRMEKERPQCRDRMPLASRDARIGRVPDLSVNAHGEDELHEMPRTVRREHLDDVAQVADDTLNGRLFAQLAYERRMRVLIVIESAARKQVTRMTVFDVTREKYFIAAQCKRSYSNSRHAAITFRSAAVARRFFTPRFQLNGGLDDFAPSAQWPLPVSRGRKEDSG